jgi:hypothetical protein
MSADRVLIVSPVHDEADHIERVARALAAQSTPPARWVVVDDASTDDTLALLRELEREIPFMRVVQRPPSADLEGSPDRLARAAAPRAFNAGLATVDPREYTHVMKLDGDIELPPDYLAELLDEFAADPDLGLAGGVLVEEVDGRLQPIRIAPGHVHGALKCYSRACFEAIGGMPECLGWDTIDESYARMRGFGARHLPDLVSRHHRPLGSADGTLRGHARHGECAYIAHFPAYWVLARSARIATRRPRGLSAVAFVGGYAMAALRRRPRITDPQLRRFVRRELRTRAWRQAATAAGTLAGSGAAVDASAPSTSRSTSAR